MEQMDITQSRELAIEFNNLTNMDKKYKFYYDETNNPRVFRFKENGDGFNWDIDANFILGGIVLASEAEVLPEVLLKELKLQKNATEFKYKHIMERCNKDFIDNLKSKRLSSLLKWIERNNAFIHFSNFDNLYWGFVDIIESIETIPFQMYNPIKNVLYKYLKKDMEFTNKMLKRFNYPNIAKSSIGDFCNYIIEWCEDLCCDSEEESFYIEILRQSLKQSKRGGELVFLENNKDLLLVENYSHIYMHKIYMLVNSEHIFDREMEIEKTIENIEVIYRNKKLENFRFEDSKKEFYIQVSDVIVGLLGKLCTFLNKHTMEEIIAKANELEGIALENIKLFAELINKSEEENRVFLHHTSSMDEINKFGDLIDFVVNYK